MEINNSKIRQVRS